VYAVTYEHHKLLFLGRIACIETGVTCSLVCICLSVGHTNEPCKNGRMRQDAIRGTNLRGPKELCIKCGHSFVCYCGQGSSLLWTPALRPLCRSNASPGRGGELVGVCCVCASCVGWRKG